MSVRHLNYTGRKKIVREHVHIGLAGLPPAATFGATLDLASYSFPGTARIVIEAQAGWTVQRFDLGTVDEPRQADNPVLSDFSSLAGLLFRLKVVATGDTEGRILGEADRLHPTGTVADASQRSFVVVRPADLGQVGWRVAFDENQPLLLINSRLGDHHEFLRRKEYLGLVLPSVLESVLAEAVTTGVDEEQSSTWQTQALRFGEHLAMSPVPTLDDEDAVDRWIYEAVDNFARRHRLLDGVLNSMEGAEE